MLHVRSSGKIYYWYLANLLANFVDKLLDATDRSIVDGSNRLSAAKAFDGPLNTQSLVRDIQRAAADRAFHMCCDVIKVVRHVSYNSQR